MSSINKVKVSTTEFDISPSPSGTLDTGTSGFTSNDVADGSATSYVTVAKIEASETNSSIFGKITSMIKNIRYIYSKIGTTDISGLSTTITGAISSLNSGKAASSHSHTVSTLPVSSTQVNSTSYIPTSALIYSMNTTLTNITPTASTTDIGEGASLTTGKIYCVYSE